METVETHLRRHPFSLPKLFLLRPRARDLQEIDKSSGAHLFGYMDKTIFVSENLKIAGNDLEILKRLVCSSEAEVLVSIYADF